MVEAVQAVRDRALRATVMGVECFIDVTERVEADHYSIVTLKALVQMKLNSSRHRDQLHLLDMLSLGMIDASWLPRLIPEHAARLQQLIDDPDG